ncbi:MAG: SDR family oxidoreductase [Bacteroidales bacterium]|nr:SDR family oxidoreductase [Bacteroidales bacterium]
MNSANEKCFITGATSGIGLSFAHKFAQRGFNLILTGRRKSELEKVAEIIVNDYQVEVELIIGDLSDIDYRDSLLDKIKITDEITVLINNAGFGEDHSFFNLNISTIRSMLSVHMFTVVELTHEVLPGMIKRRNGIIINVSSLAAFTPGISRSLYLATKAFEHHFSEALALEVQPFGIKVQSLCPGMTFTRFHNRQNQDHPNMLYKLIHHMSPEKVTEISLDQLNYNKTLCIPGTFNKVYYAASRVMPFPVVKQLAKLRAERN